MFSQNILWLSLSNVPHLLEQYSLALLFWQRNKFATSFSALLQFKQQRDFSILLTFWIFSLPEEVPLVIFFYSFDLVFVLNVLLEKVQVSHNKNNGHSKKHCFDDKTYIYGGAYHVLVIETVCVFQKCSFRRR